MQLRMLQATIVLTLMAGALTWWMLRQQLAPIGAAAAALAVHPEHGLMTEPLPVSTRDEIGQLISGFNRLLDALATREQALQASENRFSLFMESLPGAAFIKDVDGTTLYANRYMMDIVGARNWQGKSTRDIFPPEVAEKMIADDRQAMAAGHVIAQETIPTTDGRLRHFETHKFCIPRPGQPDLLGGIALDITERKQAEIALRESSELLTYAFNKSPLMKTLSDISTGKYLEVNDSFSKVSGFSREETIGKTAIELGWIGKSERGQMMQKLQQDGAVNGIELSLKCKNGQNIIGRYWGVIIHTAQGDKLFSAAEDITERKRTVLLLHEQLDELHRWQQAMLGREGRIISMKQEVNELLARSGQPPRYADHQPDDCVPGVGQPPAMPHGGGA
jgi:PAS domain S-box-containing protein